MTSVQLTQHNPNKEDFEILTTIDGGQTIEFVLEVDSYDQVSEILKSVITMPSKRVNERGIVISSDIYANNILNLNSFHFDTF